MKEKLTKDDSMTAKNNDINVVVAAFEALLEKNKLWSRYLINFSQSYHLSNSENIYSSWKEWALLTPPYRWVSDAFFWKETIETRYTWRELDYAWLIWICENLNK